MPISRFDPSQFNPLAVRAHAAGIAATRLAAQVSASPTVSGSVVSRSGNESATGPAFQASACYGGRDGRGGGRGGIGARSGSSSGSAYILSYFRYKPLLLLF